MTNIKALLFGSQDSWAFWEGNGYIADFQEGKKKIQRFYYEKL